jgi:acetyl-CoA carboxylase carboxyltransferase component
MGSVVAARLPVGSGTPGSVRAEIGCLPGFDDRPVALFRGAITGADTALVARAIEAGIEAGVPIVGVVARMGVDAGPSGLAALDGWGAVAKALTAASGVVPTALVLDGPCLGGPALVVGLVDLVLMTGDAHAFVNRAEASARIMGTNGLDPTRLGDAWTHHSRSGLADVVCRDVDEALATVGDILALLPANSHVLPPTLDPVDQPDRRCEHAAAVVPSNERASYDVRDVIADVADEHPGFLELRASFGTSLVVGLTRIAGMAVGVVANQPSQLAGALDIDSSLKGARFVRWCDAFNVPLLTLVDTPGFRPGRDQEWQGIVRHGAKLAFAYAEATVPRVSVVLRKAYGGAYIVMDCKAMGNDCALAWPSAEIAVMGARGAVEIVHRKTLAAAPADERDDLRAKLEDEYSAEHLTPRVANERGFVDAVVEPAETRRAVAEAFAALLAKRERSVRRRHENIPL